MVLARVVTTGTLGIALHEDPGRSEKSSSGSWPAWNATGGTATFYATACEIAAQGNLKAVIIMIDFHPSANRLS